MHLSVDAVEDAMLDAGLARGWATGVAADGAVGAATHQNLELGLTVVVDAVNDSDAAREVWRDVAARAEVELRFVVLLPPSTAEHQRRLHARRRGLEHVPEPSWSQVVARAEAYETWTDERIELPGAEPVEHLLRRLRSALGNAR